MRPRVATTGRDAVRRADEVRRAAWAAVAAPKADRAGRPDAVRYRAVASESAATAGDEARQRAFEAGVVQPAAAEPCRQPAARPFPVVLQPASVDVPALRARQDAPVPARAASRLSVRDAAPFAARALSAAAASASSDAAPRFEAAVSAGLRVLLWAVSRAPQREQRPLRSARVVPRAPAAPRRQQPTRPGPRRPPESLRSAAEAAALRRRAALQPAPPFRPRLRPAASERPVSPS